MRSIYLQNLMTNEELSVLIEKYGDKSLTEISVILKDELLGLSLIKLIEQYKGDKNLLNIPISSFKGLLDKTEISNPYSCIKYVEDINNNCNIETFVNYYNLLKFNLGDDWMKKINKEIDYAKSEISNMINNYVTTYPRRNDIDSKAGMYHIVLDELEGLRKFVTLNEKNKLVEKYIRDIEYKIYCISNYLTFYLD